VDEWSTTAPNNAHECRDSQAKGCSCPRFLRQGDCTVAPRATGATAYAEDAAAGEGG
jgi:hypothetical protein